MTNKAHIIVFLVYCAPTRLIVELGALLYFAQKQMVSLTIGIVWGENYKQYKGEDRKKKKKLV